MWGNYTLENRDLRIRILEIEAVRYLRQGEYELAKERLSEQLDVLLEIQKEEKTRIHKGSPYHNLGLSFLFQGKTDEAIRFIIFAYIEDLISKGKPTETDLLPASDVLRSFCGATWEDLKPIEGYVLSEKKKRVIFNPEEIEPRISSQIKTVQNNYKEYLDQAWRFEVEAQKAIKHKDHQRAVGNYKEWLDLLYKYQEKRKIRVHKGYVTFRLGLAFYSQNKMKEALDYILQAYIEDTISSRDLGQITKTYAFRVLAQLGVGLDFLDRIKAWVTNEKNEGRDVLSPKTLEQRFLSQKEVSAPKRIAPKEDVPLVRIETLSGKKTIDDLPGDYAKRVFIGGSYGNSYLKALRELAKYVEELGYYPVIAIDYDPPRDDKSQEILNVHDFDVLLIHMCNYSIFELSKAAGQYNEIEWAVRFLRKKTLGICQQGKKSKISTLIRDLFREASGDIFEYSSLSSAKDHIRSKLS